MLVRSVDGAWSETCVANLLLGLDDGTIATPADEAGPLPGTTLAVLRAAGVAIVPRRLSTTEGVRWLLLLNAVRGASVVASVEGVPLGAPPDELIALAVRLVQPPP
jgi:branched-subunit amino acid aminotransferase/4-amino-4-deoxychorismate lyase